MRKIIGRPDDAANILNRYRGTAGLLLTLSMLACSADPTAPDVQARTEDGDVASSAASEKGGGNTGGAPTESGTCPACAFGPTVFIRTTGQPVTDVATFSGNPAGAYIVEIRDLG